MPTKALSLHWLVLPNARPEPAGTGQTELTDPETAGEKLYCRAAQRDGPKLYSCAGGLAICPCPGKKPSPRIQRDLGEDILRLLQCHVSMVANLLSETELRSLHCRNYHQKIESAGLLYAGLPIIDGSAPTVMTEATAFVKHVTSKMVDGHRVALHCRQGEGRAGMMAACLLLELALVDTAEKAITYVRYFAGERCIRTRRQEDFVCAYSKGLLNARRSDPTLQR